MPNGYKTEVSPEYEEKYLQMNPGAVKGKDYGYKGDKKKGENLKQKQEGKKVSGPKKTGGTKSYSQAWKDYKASGKSKYADEASFTKAAKDWNKQKYGTTEPTAEAKSRGIDKKTLGEQHSKPTPLGTTTKTTPQLKHEVDTYKKGAASGAITTLGNLGTQGNRNNISLKSTIDNANADESLMAGTKTRREKRQARREARRQGRRDTRTTNRNARTLEKRYESTHQEKENLLTQNPVDNRSKSKRGWDKDY